MEESFLLDSSDGSVSVSGSERLSEDDRVRWDSLQSVHDELLGLSAELKQRSADMAARELAVAAREREAEEMELATAQREAALEAWRAEIAAAEARLVKRMEQEDTMLEQDRELMHARLRAAAQDEVRVMRDKHLKESARILAKLESTNKKLATTRTALQQAQSKCNNLADKNAALQASLDEANAKTRAQEEGLERARAELENMNNKLKVQTWKFDKRLGKQNESTVASKPLEAAKSNKPAEEEKERDMSYLIELVSGMAGILALGEPSNLSMLAHRILPGLCVTLELNAQSASDKQTAAHVCARVLALTLHFCGCALVAKEQGSRNMANDSDGQAAIVQGLVDRFSTRLLSRLERTAKPCSIPAFSSTGSVLAALVALSVNYLKMPMEPAAIATPLATLAASEFTPEVIAQHPSTLQPLLQVLRQCANPAWRVCSGHAVVVLLALSRDPHVVDLISQSPLFAKTCTAVLDSMEGLDRRGGAEPAIVCEAASVVAVLLQKMTSSPHASEGIYKALPDLSSTLKSLLQLVPWLEKQPQIDMDTLGFFALNAQAVLAFTSKGQRRQ